MYINLRLFIVFFFEKEKGYLYSIKLFDMFICVNKGGIENGNPSWDHQSC